MKNDSPELCHNGTMSKIDRYGWVRPNSIGELSWVDKRVLMVDHKYQRDPIEGKVREIAANFSWPAFGVVLVARRPDGSLWVVDAQHRHAAVMRRADIKDVPCIIFDMPEVATEAKHFDEVNSNRRPLTGVEKHKSNVVKGDRVAAIVDELATHSGRKIGSESSGGAIRCVRRLRSLIEQDEKCVRRIWPTIVRASHGAPMYETVVGGLFYIERRAVDASLSDKRWSQRVCEIGFDELNTAAIAGAAFFKKGSLNSWAAGILERLNKGLRESAKLKLAGDFQ